MTRPLASIIVRTLASARRADLLLRALDSILVGQDDLALPIVVVNGSDFAPALLEQLARRRDIRFLHDRRADLRAAMVTGRQLVDTPFFGFLDDDDELLPYAIQTRLAPMLAEPELDVVVTNGYCDDGVIEQSQYPGFDRIAAEPLVSLLQDSWLQSINGLYRTEAMSAADLATVPDYFEWTYLAFRLACRHTIRFLDRPTYRLNRRSSDSLSNSLRYLLGEPDALRAMLGLDLPPEIKRALRAKLSASFHHIAAVSRENGDYSLAWRTHLKSLVVGDGWRWFPYTVRLLT